MISAFVTKTDGQSLRYVYECGMAATSPEVLADEGTGPERRVDAAHLDSLTGYRGLSALVVLVVHGSGHTAYPDIGIRGYGPIALFVLSGYLLVSPWSRWSLGESGRPNLGTFARRRVARIFPAYLVLLLVVALVYPASRPKDGYSWLRAATFMNWLRPDGLRPAMEHLWSMGPEFTWYFVLPLVGTLLWFLGRKVIPRSTLLPALAVLALAIGITVGWLWWIANGDLTLDQLLTLPLWLPAYFVCFVAGATVRHVQLAASATGRGAWMDRLGRHWWVPAGVAVIATAVLVSPLSGPSGYVSLSWTERNTRTIAALVLALGLLVAAVTSPPKGPFARFFGWAPLVAVGRWSYGIYLWHLPVTIYMVTNHTVPTGPVGFVVWIFMLGGISAVLGTLSYRYVEQPAIEWSKSSQAKGARARHSTVKA